MIKRVGWDLAKWRESNRKGDKMFRVRQAPPVEVRVDLGDLAAVMTLAQAWPACFSCNKWRRSWISQRGTGYSDPSTRTYVEGVSELVDLCTELVLSVRPPGGRFEVRDTGLYIADGDRKLASFALAGILTPAS